jgi:predicted RNase H-like nuclease (RuvC/YqgF family)
MQKEKRITELEQTVARLSDALQTQMQLRLKKAVNFEAALWNSGTLDVALRETASAREQVESAVIWDEFLQAMDERGWNIQNLTP